MQRLRSSCLDLARAWAPRALGQAECSSAAPLWARLSSSAAAGSAEAPSALTGLQSVKKALRPQARSCWASLPPLLIAAAAAATARARCRTPHHARHLLLLPCRIRAATPSAAPGPSSCRSRQAIVLRPLSACVRSRAVHSCCSATAAHLWLASSFVSSPLAVERTGAQGGAGSGAAAAARQAARVVQAAGGVGSREQGGGGVNVTVLHCLGAASGLSSPVAALCNISRSAAGVGGGDLTQPPAASVAASSSAYRAAAAADRRHRRRHSLYHGP